MPNSIEYWFKEERYFEKVSEEQYIKDVQSMLQSEILEEDLRKELADIELPVRATQSSAGYDFHAPCDIIVTPHHTILIPTGIKVKMMPDEILSIYPRSSLGFKYNIRLANSVGIVDADYYNNENNEGHIMIKLYNPSEQSVKLNKGDRFAQGIFTKFLTTTDEEEIETTRQGGMGSTN